MPDLISDFWFGLKKVFEDMLDFVAEALNLSDQP